MQTDIKQIYEDTKNYLPEIEESKNKFEILKVNSISTYNYLKNNFDSLRTQINETQNLKEELQNILTEIQKIKQDTEQNKNSISSDFQAVNTIKLEFEGLRNETQSLHTDLKGRQTDAQQNIDSIYDLSTKFSNLHNDLLVDTRDENNNFSKLSTLTQINDLFHMMLNQLEEMKENRNTAKTETDNLKISLEKEIRSLLPDAGAAGLSSAYVQSKSKYGYIPYEKENKKSWGHTWHLIRSIWPTLIYYTMFILPLTMMVWLFYDLFKTLNEVSEKVILFRAVITFPLSIISLFGWSSIRLSRRLYEEYNHKQRVMQLYHSFKDEINEHWNDEHKKALLTVMLKAVNDKPSLTMHRYDKGIEWHTFNVSSLFPFTNNKNT